MNSPSPAELDPIREKLQTAVELELTTIPPYLTAMFSIKPGTNVAAAKLIRSVFMEEMLHMVMAANILSAIGGSLNLQKPNAPDYPCKLTFQGKPFKDRQFDIHLARLDTDSLDLFMEIEMPDFLLPVPPTMVLGDINIPGITVGKFYRDLQDDLRKLCHKYPDETKLFYGNPALQVSEQYYWGGGGKPIVVRNLADALAAIDVIVEQGEGTLVGPPETYSNFFADPAKVPHYFRFKEIRLGQIYKPGDDPTGPPSGDPLPVDFGEVYPLKPDCKTSDYASQPELLRLDDLFNSNYTTMLCQIEEGFNGNPAAFYTAILNGMHNLTPIAMNMVQIQIDNDPNGRHAAPSFKWI